MAERLLGFLGKRYKAREDGGLGIIDLRTFNLALLGK